MEPLKVDIWSDIVCPWCYIGKRRFETALGLFAQREHVVVEWHSFELDPSAPPRYAGTLEDALAAKKGISKDRSAAMHAQLTELAAQDGLVYRFDIAQLANSFDAHRLLQFAKARQLASAIKERLMRAYFTEGRLISDHATLIDLATEVGVSADEARAMLQSDAYAAQVRDDEQLAGSIGINGVPFFVVNGRYGISGAQPVPVFLNALEEIWAEAQSQPQLAPEDAV